MRGGHTEGRRRLAQLLEAAGEARRTAAGVRALDGAARLAHDHNEYDTAAKIWAESLAIARELGDLDLILEVIWGESDRAAARSVVEESLAIYRERGDRRGRMKALEVLGELLSMEGDTVMARPYLEESLAIHRACGSPQRVGWLLWRLGMNAGREGQLQAARAFHDESLPVFRELQDKFGMATALQEPGWVAVKQGDWKAACLYFGEALPLFREIGNFWAAADCLIGLAEAEHRLDEHERSLQHYQKALVLVWGHDQKLRVIVELLSRIAGLTSVLGQTERTVRLLGAVDVLRPGSGHDATPEEIARDDRILKEARDALGQEALRRRGPRARQHPRRTRSGMRSRSHDPTLVLR
jgi:tetratricopeptide (TPR) repeat protein